jgi:hypothetical protein
MYALEDSIENTSHSSLDEQLSTTKSTRVTYTVHVVNEAWFWEKVGPVHELVLRELNTHDWKLAGRSKTYSFIIQLWWASGATVAKKNVCSWGVDSEHFSQISSSTVHAVWHYILSSFIYLKKRPLLTFHTIGYNNAGSLDEGFQVLLSLKKHVIWWAFRQPCSPNCCSAGTRQRKLLLRTTYCISS